jgi:hypothetical protein
MNSGARRRHWCVIISDLADERDFAQPLARLAAANGAAARYRRQRCGWRPPAAATLEKKMGSCPRGLEDGNGTTVKQLCDALMRSARV